MESRNHQVNGIVERLPNNVKTEKIVNDKISEKIGDLFKDSLKYVDTKWDMYRDLLKGLFAQVTSASFVTKLQGVANKTAIMNVTDDIKENVRHYTDIATTFSVVMEMT